MSAMPKKYRSKPGRDPLPEEEKRLLFTISIANRVENGSLLSRFRSAVECKEGHMPSRDELQEIAKQLSYHAIDAYCEGVERDNAAIIL